MMEENAFWQARCPNITHCKPLSPNQPNLEEAAHSLDERRSPEDAGMALASEGVVDVVGDEEEGDLC